VANPAADSAQSKFEKELKEDRSMRLGPGLSFSLSRALGISAAKARISRRIGIPLTESGRERKVGRAVLRGSGLAIWVLIALAFSQCRAHAAYWDQCNKSRNQYYDEPFASRELACNALKGCPARYKCYARLDADAAAAMAGDDEGRCWMADHHLHPCSKAAEKNQDNIRYLKEREIMSKFESGECSLPAGTTPESAASFIVNIESMFGKTGDPPLYGIDCH
jgi:hypothetical protein